MAANSPDVTRAGRIPHWLLDCEWQNLGDYLSEYLVREVLEAPRIAADGYRLIGSAIAEFIIADDLASLARNKAGTVAFWCCGMREDAPLPAEALSRSSFHGVRGPLTRDRLGLPPDTAIGDPALLLPLFHEPARTTRTRGKTICVPHFNDPKSDDELLALSGAEIVVRPRIANTIEALQAAIDQIATAGFVLAGSLHAAIIACAYDVPFGFWDNGFVDLPFKWRDFAASINVAAAFVMTVEDGRSIYRTVIARRIRKPRLTPILQACPFHIRPAVLQKAIAADGAIPIAERRPVAVNRVTHIHHRALRESYRKAAALEHAFVALSDCAHDRECFLRERLKRSEQRAAATEEKLRTVLAGLPQPIAMERNATAALFKEGPRSHEAIKAHGSGPTGRSRLGIIRLVMTLLPGREVSRRAVFHALWRRLPLPTEVWRRAHYG